MIYNLTGPTGLGEVWVYLDVIYYGPRITITSYI